MRPALEPFRAPTSLLALAGAYPEAQRVLDALRNGDIQALRIISQLWLSEGIPFAFRDNPAIYQSLRDWLADRLGIEAKAITLIGSGRIGYSLGRDAPVGRAFGSHSDLDLTVVSSDLFRRLHDSFRDWERDYSRGRAYPRHAGEKKYWDENRSICNRTLLRGFIDPHKIPTRKLYPEVIRVMDALWRVHQKLKKTAHAPIIRKASVRVYRNWPAFVRQMAINLRAIANSAGMPDSGRNI